MRGVRMLFALGGLLLAPLFMSPSAAAKDGITEILGAVQSMPSSGFVGVWTIAGQSVRVDAATVVKQELGRVGLGAIVEAKATTQSDGSLLATVIEVKQGVPGNGGGGGDDAGQIAGAIQSLPASGLIGTWRVASRTVVVVSTTRLDQERGGFQVGATVEVHGIADAAGVITASSIELKLGGAAVPMPIGPEHELEVLGTVTQLPASGLIGDWRVGGRLVRVTTSTVLDAEHGAFAVGVTVEVHGRADTVGALVATRIERTEGNGAPVPALEFWGAVEALPPATTAPIGLWRVGGRLVNVSDSTAIRQNDAPLALGVIVEVSGWLQADGVVEAHEIETRTALGAVPGQGERAIEYVNEKLGHYFLTAFPAEIAALDGGAFDGAWKRTGESFRVGGGAASACRFYGMPPAGPDSHFFTVDPNECEKVMRDYHAWTYEAHAFSISAPVDGACGAGLVPVVRFYNNPAAGSDMNHRYVVSSAAGNEVRGRGWIEEGVVMCARP